MMSLKTLKLCAFLLSRTNRLKTASTCRPHQTWKFKNLQRKRHLSNAFHWSVLKKKANQLWKISRYAKSCLTIAIADRFQPNAWVLLEVKTSSTTSLRTLSSKSCLAKGPFLKSIKSGSSKRRSTTPWRLSQSWGYFLKSCQGWLC